MSETGRCILGHDGDVEHGPPPLASRLVPSLSVDSPATGERGPGRFGVTYRADGDTLPFGSLPRPPWFDGVPSNLTRVLDTRGSNERAWALEARFRLHRVGRERHGRADHLVLDASGVMTTGRKLGAMAIMTVAVILTGCTTSTAPTPTSTTAPLRKAPPGHRCCCRQARAGERHVGELRRQRPGWLDGRVSLC